MRFQPKPGPVARAVQQLRQGFRLGDAVHNVLAGAGLRACGGCRRRQVALNRFRIKI